MKKFTCPYCYGEHTIKDCKMKCSFDMVISGKKYACKKDIEKAAEAKTAEATKNAEGWIPQALYAKCLKCQEVSKQIFCPIYKEEEIPSIFLSGTGLSIALLGAQGSGKSNYIGVLIDEIQRKMTLKFNCTVDMCCSEKSEKYYNHYYYTPLFKQNHVLAATEWDRFFPMICSLRFMDKKNQIKNMARLTFCDVAGERMSTINEDDPFCEYISNAKGIVLLLDPLQVPSIREKLKIRPLLESEWSRGAEEILGRVINNIRNMKKLGIHDKIKIPIALVVTKIDILEQYNILPFDSCLREESKHLEQGGFVLSEFENTYIEMRNLLEEESSLLKTVENFSKYSIFGVSSLGAAPNGYKLSGEPNPRRVLDPLLWLLAENKYIKTISRERR